MKLKMIHYTTFRIHARRYIQPAIVHSWKTAQDGMLQQLRQQQNIVLGGDTRYLMLNNCLSLHITVKAKHTYLREDNITQYYDVWHIENGVSKKLLRIAQNKDSEKLQKWYRSIKKHIYCTAASSSSGPERVAKWVSILNQIQNMHTHDDPIFPRFLHLQRTTTDKSKWLSAGTAAFSRLEKILRNKRNERSWRNKMAPVLMACLLSVLSCLFFMVVLLTTLFIHDATSALIYDRHTLFNIRSSFEKYLEDGRGELQLPITKPPQIIPTWLKREPWPLLEKKRRRRGKQGVKLVKLKAYLVSLQREPCPADVLLWGWSGDRVLCRRSGGALPRWVRPVGLAEPVVAHSWRALRPYWRGANLRNLRPVPLGLQQSDGISVDDAGPEIRIYLAALHFNENAGRPQATTAAGEPLFKVVFPKYKKGQCSAKPVKVEPTF
uniref:Uncharacterized protein n=1 Tax=Cyprinus carpio carpio TaxID=630221 RepID=A0A9J8CEC9_CYPCA